MSYIDFVWDVFSSVLVAMVGLVVTVGVWHIFTGIAKAIFGKQRKSDTLSWNLYYLGLGLISEAVKWTITVLAFYATYQAIMNIWK